MKLEIDCETLEKTATKNIENFFRTIPTLFE